MEASTIHSHCLAMASDAQPPAWAAWLADVQGFAPHLFGECPTCAAPDVPISGEAFTIAESCEALKAAGSADNWSAIYGTRSAILANTLTRDREHGDVHPFRAAVDTLCREYDGTPTAVARAVDPYDGQRSDVKRGRNKKGATAVVRRHGRSTVQGSTAVTGDDRRALFAAHLIEQTDALPCGRSAIAVTQVTQTAYGDLLEPVAYGVSGDTIRTTTLLGGETVAWSESSVDPTTLKHAVAETAVQGFTIAHRVTADGRSETVWTSATPDGEAVPLVSIPIEGRTFDDDGRVIWQAHATCSHTDQTRRGKTARTNLARVNIRKAERPLTEPVNGRTALLASADSDTAVFIGHQRVTRKARQPRQQGTANRSAKRATARAKAAPSVEILTEQGWLELVEAIEPGQGIKLTANGHRVSITRSAHAGKLNVRVTVKGRTAMAVQVRSSSTAARRLAALTA